ncbi:MAG: hypothetical protein HY774_10495 [Acidobacteria bacterium]|nr:hypothetical protein [Acidobacteriota bacterium]
MKYTRLSHRRRRSPMRHKPQHHRKYRQQGIALAIALILLGVLMVFTSLAATLMTSEARLSAAQYNNARTFNAGMASLELMTDKINTLFTSNFNPTAAEIEEQAALEPIYRDGSTEIFDFQQKVTQLGGNRALVTVLDPPFEGLTARERLFRLEAIAQDTRYNTQVRLIRDVANYQIPIFQFAVFGFDSLDVSPGPKLWLGGRTHTNRNLFLMVRNGGNTTEFYGKITTVGEVCTEILPSGRGVVAGESETGRHEVYDPATLGLRDIEPSVNNATGPDNPGVPTIYDYNLNDDPTSPNGGVKTAGALPAGLVVTGIPRLLLPTESKGFQAIEILRRGVPTDTDPENEALQNTRFFNGVFARYSTMRILLDDDIEEFPDPIGAEPRAYDLNDLADPTNAFWRVLTDNVRQFNPNTGNDHPDQPAGTATVGAGNPIAGAVVTPPQTNLINNQPEFQRTEDGNVSALRKRTYIKIELLINDQSPNPPTRIDITPQILNLGITAGPIPVVETPNLTAGDLQGNNNATSPDGRLRASTTYVRNYPLNDTRLPNTTTDNTIESMLPWLENSTTNANIGKFKGALGGLFTSATAQATVKIRGDVNRTSSISYRFEPNAILRLQRTYFPYVPNNNIDVTTADVPTTSDAPTAQTAINNPAGSTGRIGGYPAKFKSLIAKPYFRFTDQFDNLTYVKGRGTLSNGMFELVNPFAEFPNTETTTPDNDIIPNSRQRVYAGNGVLGNGADTRFIRAIEMYGASCVTNNTNPGKPNATGSFEITSSGPGGLLPFADNTNAQEPNTGQLQAARASINRDELFNLLSTLWTNNAALKQQLCQRIREHVFKPGIPGFYALAWDNNGTGSNVIGDGRIDLDVNWDLTPEDAENSDPRLGVIDLNEMTIFPNLDPGPQQPKLTAFRTNVGSLAATDFTHLSWPITTINPNGNNIPSYLKEDPATGNNTFDLQRTVASFLAGLKNVEPGMTNPATAELPRENIAFDWNGDGLIEPPHRPFQGGTISRNSTITEGVALGYSVESNICSLIPSTLRVSPSPSTTADRVTSVPVEVRLVEQNPALPGFTPVTWVDPANNNAALQTYVNGLMAANPGGIPFNQADPDPGAGTGFTNNTNSFRFDVPFWTFQRIRGLAKTGTSYNYGIVIRVRSAVRIVFQHPLAPRGVSAASYPTNVGFTAAQIAQTGDATQIGRNLGLTDAHYAFPGHCYLDFVSDPANDNLPTSSPAIWLPRVRTVTDTAFPINVYDQREGRHISRAYGFQGIPTAADYYSADVGASAQRIVENQWPDWPGTATLADNDRMLYNMGQLLPMPSPIALERIGMMNMVEVDMGNLKRLFRGDFNNYLATFPGPFTSGQPRNSPIGDPATVWGGNGIIDISDNGLIVYISNRCGDDNNDGIYELNDVFGENGVLDPLDDTVNTVLDPNSPQKGKPGDGLLRRDMDVETQPVSVPNDNAPARTGEAPHGSVPVNDGFEYFCGNINTTTWRVTVPDNVNPTQTNYTTLLNGNGIGDTLEGVTNSAGTAPAPTATGAINWRIVDSAKTGRIRAFRRGVRLVNGWDIPRWYLNQDGPTPRHFTGMSLIAENPVYIYGNLNAIGVQEQPSTIVDPDSGLPVGGPTASRRFLQTGNDNMPLVPGNFNATPAVTGGANDGLLHGPMSIMADGVSIQSRAYQDARMFISQGGHSYRPQTLLRRYAMETTVKSAWLTGQPKAGVQTSSQQTIDDNGDAVNLNSGNSPNTQGGVHNFPRFCETWTWPAGLVRFNYNGSFIYQFYSQQGNGLWKIGGPSNASHYNAPPRNWNFDSAFRTLGGLPPGTPRVSFYKIRGFRQVFIEDQD